MALIPLKHNVSGHFEFGQKSITVPWAQEQVSEHVSEQMSGAERLSKASSAEQANEWAVRVNGRADGQVAQY